MAARLLAEFDEPIGAERAVVLEGRVEGDEVVIDVAAGPPAARRTQ
jgi:hypothetical protein